MSKAHPEETILPTVNNWIHRAEKPHSRDASYRSLSATATNAPKRHAAHAQHCIEDLPRGTTVVFVS
jgi:hypothetical protein